MNALYHEGLEGEEEFDWIFNIASKLWLKQKNRRDRCVEQLADIGVKAVGPILYVIELDACSDYEDPDEYDAFYESAIEVFKCIGKPALPILERYIEEGGANMAVNTFAQEAVFAILGLNEEGRKKVCKHGQAIRYEKDGMRIYVCAICEREMDEGEYK